MIAALALAIAPFASAQGALAPARYELVGPLEAARLELPSGAATTVSAALLPGERRTLVLPFDGRGHAAGLAPHVSELEPPGGEARFLGWLETPAPLPAGLAARPRPPVAVGGAAVGRVQALVLFGVWFAVLGLRRRPLAALAAGGAAAAALLALPLAEHAGLERARVLEGSAAGWIQVDAAARELRLEPGGASTGRVELEPPDAALDWSALLDGGGLRWVGRAPGARLHHLARHDPGPRILSRELNAWASFEATWTRGPAGWAFHGAWGTGRPLPPPREGPPAPGWLAAGMPQGAAVLVARLAPSTTDPHPPGGKTEPQAVWLRFAGDF